MNNIYFADKNRFKEIKMNFRKDGFSKIHFLADFDRTLTKAYKDGIHIPSLIGVLREQNILGDEVTKKENELYAKYRPQEENPNINLKEKKEILENWWKETFELLIKNGLTKNHIKETIDSGKLVFREGMDIFLEITNKFNIPIVIISATAFGVYSLKEYFNKYSIYNGNISYIGNNLNWGSNGKFISYEKPIIHSFNKDETLISNFPKIYEKIENKKNIILLGDSLGDHHMSDGFEYNNILKVGFLNENKEKLMNSYLERYDVVITGDGDMSFINEFLNNILT